MIALRPLFERPLLEIAGAVNLVSLQLDWQETLMPKNDNPMLTVALNHFDAEGNQVDTSTMELSESSVSDIVDHASQLAIVMRDMRAKRCGIEAFDQVYAELNEALVQAGVIAHDSEPLPCLGLLK